VREIPRLGLLGWPKTFLEIGLPLSLAVAPEELHAILAHEFAHLSARHGRSGGRIYRIHRTWSEVFQRMQRPASGSFGRGARWVTSKFIEWYWPRLHAHAFVLSRAQEYQADRLAAEIAGPTAMASALWRLECLNPWFSERFWPEFYREATQLPEPPEVVDRMRRAFQAPLAPDDAARWTARGVSRATGNDDTHPSLRDRISSLGLSVEDIAKAGFPVPVSPSAAEALMGADLDAIEKDLTADWRNNNRAAWLDRHRRAATEARRNATKDVERPAEPHPAAAAALWESAREMADLRGLPSAEPLLRDVLYRDPAHSGAGVLLGYHLLNIGDPDGESLLWQVVERADQGWVGQAYQALQDHYRSTAQTERLREVRARHDRHEADVAKGQLERSRLEAGDTFLHHGLTCEQLEPLRRVLSARSDCGAAWLVRKKLLYFPDRPLFVLCVRGKYRGWRVGRDDRERTLVRQLVPSVELPGSVLVIAPVDQFRRLARKVMAIADTEVLCADKLETTSSTQSNES
jgi:hypothetical protein